MRKKRREEIQSSGASPVRGETVEVEEALREVKYSRRQCIGAVKSEKRAEDPHLEISTRNVIFHRFGLPLPQSQSSQFQ